MKYKLKILSYDSENHSIIVRYYSDTLSETILAISNEKRSDGSPVQCMFDYNIELPVKIDSLTEDEIKHEIFSRIPRYSLDKKEKEILNTANKSPENIIPMIGLELEYTDPKKIDDMSDQEIDELLKKITS